MMIGLCDLKLQVIVSEGVGILSAQSLPHISRLMFFYKCTCIDDDFRNGSQRSLNEMTDKITSVS